MKIQAAAISLQGVNFVVALVTMDLIKSMVKRIWPSIPCNQNLGEYL